MTFSDSNIKTAHSVFITERTVCKHKNFKIHIFFYKFPLSQTVFYSQHIIRYYYIYIIL